jgi:hypothetical protein
MSARNMKAYGILVVETHSFLLRDWMLWVTASYPDGYTSRKETPHTLNIMNEPQTPSLHFQKEEYPLSPPGFKRWLLDLRLSYASL